MEKITTTVTHADKKVSNSEMKLMLKSGIPDTDFKVVQKHPLGIPKISTAKDCYKLTNKIANPSLLSTFEPKINILNELTKLVKNCFMNIGLMDTNWIWNIVETQDGLAAHIRLEVHPNIKASYDAVLKHLEKRKSTKHPSDQVLELFARLFAEILSDIKFIDQSDVEFMAAKYYLSKNNYSLILPHIDKIKLCYLEELLVKSNKLYWVKESHQEYCSVFGLGNGKKKYIKKPTREKFIEKGEKAETSIEYSNPLSLPITHDTMFIDVSGAVYDVDIALLEYVKHHNISNCQASELNNTTYIKGDIAKSIRKRLSEKRSDPEAAQNIFVIGFSKDVSQTLMEHFNQQLTHNRTVVANISLFRTKFPEALDIAFRGGTPPSSSDDKFEQPLTNLNPYVKIEFKKVIDFDNESAKNMFDNFIKHHLIIIEDDNILINASLDEKKFEWLVNWLVDKSLLNVDKPVTFRP